MRESNEDKASKLHDLWNRNGEQTESTDNQQRHDLTYCQQNCGSLNISLPWLPPRSLPSTLPQVKDTCWKSLIIRNMNTWNCCRCVSCSLHHMILTLPLPFTTGYVSDVPRPFPTSIFILPWHQLLLGSSTMADAEQFYSDDIAAFALALLTKVDASGWLDTDNVVQTDDGIEVPLRTPKPVHKLDISNHGQVLDQPIQVYHGTGLAAAVGMVTAGTIIRSPTSTRERHAVYCTELRKEAYAYLRPCGVPSSLGVGFFGIMAKMEMVRSKIDEGFPRWKKIYVLRETWFRITAIQIVVWESVPVSLLYRPDVMAIEDLPMFLPFRWKTSYSTWDPLPSTALVTFAVLHLRKVWEEENSTSEQESEEATDTVAPPMEDTIPPSSSPMPPSTAPTPTRPKATPRPPSTPPPPFARPSASPQAAAMTIYNESNYAEPTTEEIDDYIHNAAGVFATTWNAPNEGTEIKEMPEELPRPRRTGYRAKAAGPYGIPVEVPFNIFQQKPTSSIRLRIQELLVQTNPVPTGVRPLSTASSSTQTPGTSQVAILRSVSRGRRRREQGSRERSPLRRKQGGRSE